MDVSDLVLASVPPLLAMLIEGFNPISPKSIRLSAERDLADFRSLAEFSMLVDSVACFTTAMVEVSGITPTLVSACVSGFVVIHALTQPFWPIMIYCVALILVIVPVLRLLTTTTYLDLETMPVRNRLFHFRSGTSALSMSIYLLNTLLIVVSIASFLMSRDVG